MDWCECKQRKIVKEIDIDESLITSLHTSSRRKNTSASLLPANDDTFTSIISLQYDAMREKLEALALKKGLKIYNHECYVAFLKEIYSQEELSKKFDIIRIKRNRINYYGEELTEQAFLVYTKKITELHQSLEELK